MQETFLLNFAAAADDTTLVSPLGALIDKAVDGMYRLYGCRDEILSSLEQLLRLYRNPGTNLDVSCRITEWIDSSYKLFCEEVATILREGYNIDLQGSFVAEYVQGWTEDTRTEEWLRKWDSMKLISLRDAEFGSLTENSWCRWVNIALDAIQSGELCENEPVIKFYGSLLTLTWDDASYERNFDGKARSSLEAILRVAEFALHGVRNYASELRLPGWLTEHGLRHQSQDVLCWRPLEYPGVKAIRIMKDYRFHIKFVSTTTAERFREELRKCGNPEVVAQRSNVRR